MSVTARVAAAILMMVIAGVFLLVPVDAVLQTPTAASN